MTFRTARENGQSHADVLITLVKDAQPGTTFSYDDLIAALQPGTTKQWTVPMVRSAVYGARRRLFKEVQRALIANGIGYRVAAAAEHQRVALVHRRKAQRQYQKEALVLTGTRLDELTPTERITHEAHLSLTLAIAQQVAYLTRRQKVQDKAIDNLISRVERLEVVG